MSKSYSRDQQGIRGLGSGLVSPGRNGAQCRFCRPILQKTENGKRKTILLGLLCLLLLAAGLRQEDDPLCPGPGPAGAGAGVPLGSGRQLPGGRWLCPGKTSWPAPDPGPGLPGLPGRGLKGWRRSSWPPGISSCMPISIWPTPSGGKSQGEAMLFKDRELTPGPRYYYRVAALTRTATWAAGPRP